MSNLEQIFINVKNGSNSFDVTSVGFDTEKQYTVSEFNQTLKKANEKWQENWDGLSYPDNRIIVTVENLHTDPCTYRVNLTDADYNSIQDIVDLSPTPMHASISTDKAIQKLNEAEANAREQGIGTAEQDTTFAYKTGARSEPFTVIVLDIRSEERKAALSYALNSIINSGYYKSNPDQALPYKDVLEKVKSTDKYMQVFGGALSCLKYALRQSNDNELCAKMLDSIHYAENNITRENEFREPFQLGEELNKAIHTAKNKVEHIPQQQDISHITNNAALSAAKTANGQKGSSTMSNTKMECTSMFLSEDNTYSKTKAVAAITVNDEFVIKGIKMYESSDGNLDIVMPSRKFGSDYQDVVFPITAEAREQMKQAVLNAYVKVVESGLDRLPLEAKDAPEKSASKVTVSINLYQSNDEAKSNVKAVGQIVIDDCIVVSGVTVRSANKDGVEQNFVSMPSFKKMDDFGETTYSEYAHAITKECYAKISNAVLGAYETLQKTEYKGVKLSELGEKTDISTKYGMNSNFAAKLMSELEKNGIAYSAKVLGTTAISVRNTDRAAVDKIEKALSDTLKKEAQKSEQQPDQKKTAPKKNKAH